MGKIDNDVKLTFLGHITELRNRLLKSVIAIIVTTIIAFVFADQIFHVLISPLNGNPLFFIDMTEMLGVYMRVGLMAGIMLAMPFLTYQVMMFITPALTPQEKKYIRMIIPWVSIMFIFGVVFSYFVLLPPAIRFLVNFGNDIAIPQIRIGSYINVATRILLASGLIFELPVASTFLARVGIISSSWLAGKRKFAIILAFVLAALITPTFDPVNQTLVAAPLIVLYEMSIWLARLVQRRNPRTILTEPVKE